MDGGADVTAVDKLRIVASARSRHLMAKNFRVSVSSREILLSCNLHRSRCFTQILLKELPIGHMVRDLTGTAVVFLKFLLKGDDNFQVQLR